MKEQSILASSTHPSEPEENAARRQKARQQSRAQTDMVGMSQRQNRTQPCPEENTKHTTNQDLLAL